MAEVHIEGHSSPIKTPQQLAVVVVLSFLVPVLAIILVVKLVTGGLKLDPGSPAMSEEAVAQRLKPVGEIAVAQAVAPAGEGRSGQEVYTAACSACHAAGLMNAPKTGNAGAWKPRIAQGQKTLVSHAINGIRQMPARGGNPSLTDLEVERAVVYMANQSGGNLKEPATGAKPAAVAAAAPARERTGKQIVKSACGKCHQTGEFGAPKVGDKDAWRKRLASGLDAVTSSAIHGHGGMPARGGFADLTDTEVRNAIIYMFSASGVDVKAGKPAPAAAAPAEATAGSDPAIGKKAYESVCVACHLTGLAGAPKPGDKAAWKPRIAQGMDTLYSSVLKGKNAMPARGGSPTLSDADIKAAVDYLVGLAK